jgi:uncharacterized metal-binding protein YceD (DUF177 family)
MPPEPPHKQAEFSRLVRVADVPSSGLVKTFAATPAERAALADRLGVLEIRLLEGDVAIRPHGRAGIAIAGTFRAEVAQACVVTLEPVEQSLSGEFSARYLPEAEAARLHGGNRVEEGELVLSAEGDDPPETMEDGRIDFGEAVAQHLSLALDPFPRKEGVSIPEINNPEEKSARPSPFAVLKGLRDKR